VQEVALFLTEGAKIVATTRQSGGEINIQASKLQIQDTFVSASTFGSGEQEICPWQQIL